jgi:hypothetical protein
MIIVSLKGDVVKLEFEESGWNKLDFDKSISALMKVLEKAAAQQRRVRMILIGNKSVNQQPPLKFWMWVVAVLVRNRNLLKRSLNKTAIVDEKGGMKKWFDFVFSRYTPSRPLKIFSDLEEAWAFLDTVDAAE